MSADLEASFDYELLAAELIRALRGKRSCAEASRRAGYRSNIVHRWEAQHCWPTAADLFAFSAHMRPRARSWIDGFFHVPPAWADGVDPTSPQAVAAFLQHLRGKTSIVRIARLAQRNRFAVARWLDGSSQPRLPDFLRMVNVTSHRLPDLIATIEEPSRIPSLRRVWAQQQLALKAAYELPWSHAVLRALELTPTRLGTAAQQAFVADKLGITNAQVKEALAVLEVTEQVVRTRSGYRPREVNRVDTSRDPIRGRELKLAWTSTALERLRRGAPGHYGWSLFAVSKADLERLHDLHMQYVRAMQDVIASSKPSECVGLYCAQLLDLSSG